MKVLAVDEKLEQITLSGGYRVLKRLETDAAEQGIVIMKERSMCNGGMARFQIYLFNIGGMENTKS